MPATRLVLVAVLALGLASPAAAATRPKLKAPSNVRGFYLRSDEPARTAFTRTPAFAWNPVAGAAKYEFIISTSPLFRNNGIVYDDSTLTSPAAAPPIALPWVTSSPHALYARARALGQNGSVGPWSDAFGFDMRWTDGTTPGFPQQLSAPDGLMHWTSVDGATSYQVKFEDFLNIDGAGLSKTITTTLTVADEREYYTFHNQPSTWQKLFFQDPTSAPGSVHWRVRAVRTVWGKRKNNLPATSYGPWSPFYTSVNGDMSTGLVQPVETFGDVISTKASPQTHQEMPGFVYSGNQDRWGNTRGLYRIYVTTDPDCLNVVFAGSVVGSPAYAPRSAAGVGGPSTLKLPSDVKTLALAAGFALGDGSQSSNSFENGPVIATEQQPPASFAATVITPPAAPSAPTAPATGSTGSTPSDPAATPAPTPAPVSSFPGTITADGAPIDLWDTAGHYYWAAMPVRAFIDPIGGGITWWDSESLYDVCASGRVSEFGKTSPAPVTGSTTPYVTGLSTTGRLTAAFAKKPVVYGAPLVAWAPVLGAAFYEVQWSKTTYPWRPVGNSYTFATAATLPLTPATWYYRVRGINMSLPSEASWMSWADPVAVVVAKPKFKLVKP